MAGKRKKKRDKRQEFEEVALPLMDGLFAMAMKLTSNRDDASDLVQETYLKAYKAFDRFEWGTNIRAWMFKILVNTYYNIHRHRKIGKDIADASGGFWTNREVISQETLRAFRDPHSAVTGRMRTAEIEAAVKELPEDYRTVFLLADVQGFSYKEVASSVGCPIGTVMSRLHRARRLLQKSLLGDGIFEREERGEGADVAFLDEFRTRKAGGGES
jgi:RNA polymerase sigma-70 factor (ECF subfamily)